MMVNTFYRSQAKYNEAFNLKYADFEPPSLNEFEWLHLPDSSNDDTMCMLKVSRHQSQADYMKVFTDDNCSEDSWETWYMVLAINVSSSACTLDHGEGATWGGFVATSQNPKP